MLCYTGDKPTQSSQKVWDDLAGCYPHTVSEDTRRVVVCDILHNLQALLQKEVCDEIEQSYTSETNKTATAQGSDDVALYRLGGWALFSATKFRCKAVKLSPSNCDVLKEEIELLNAIKIPHDEKDTLPPALQYLDRGGLTFPRQELLPYLKEIEMRMLDVLNETNYRRYGKRLFEVCYK